jgi:hypothetical protein
MKRAAPRPRPKRRLLQKRGYGALAVCRTLAVNGNWQFLQREARRALLETLRLKFSGKDIANRWRKSSIWRMIIQSSRYSVKKLGGRAIQLLPVLEKSKLS